MRRELNHVTAICGMALAFLVVSGLLSGSARAQFSGPAIGSSTPVNLPVTITTDPAILYPAAREIVLGNGDLFSVHLFGTTDYAPTVRVGLDGTVQLPLIGTLSVAGLSIPQAVSLIAEKLVNAGMYREPQVSIQLMESPNQTATVIGELHGVVPILGRRRLLEVLAAVGGGGGGSASGTTIVVGGGGLPTTASHVITILRPGVAEPINVDLGIDPDKSAQANVPIFAGDTIIISRVGVVYLLGAFKTQGAIPLQQNAPLTLMKVAALAGGPGFEGRANDLRIIRTVGVERQELHIDINKVFKGEVPDPVLQAEDIIFLPTNPMKAAIKSGGLSTLLGIASILLIAIQN
jgi:polysaccharide export outer membrane protein